MGINQLFVRHQAGTEIEQPQTRAVASRSLNTQWIAQRHPEHLHTAANTDNFSAIAQMPQQSRLPTLRTQPSQIMLNVFTTGQYHQISGRKTFSWTHIAKIDLRVCAQCIEIGVIADTRIHRNGDAYTVT